MEKINKNTVAECYTIAGTDIAQGYADFLRDKLRLKEKVAAIEKDQKKQKHVSIKDPLALWNARKIRDDKKNVAGLDKTVEEKFYSTFYVWHNFNSFLFWDLIFSDDVVTKLLRTFPKLSKEEATEICNNMMEFRAWLLDNVTDKKKLEEEIQYRQQEFFQDMHNAMQILHISPNQKEINWNICLHRGLQVLAQTDEYNTARKIFKYFIFAVKNFHAISLYLQGRIKPIKPVNEFDTKGFKWLPKTSTKNVHFILDQFLEDDKSFYVVSRNDARMISRFQQEDGAFKHSKYDKLFVKYCIVLTACEIMLRHEWIACTVKYNRRSRSFTVKPRTKSFAGQQQGKYLIKVVDEKKKPIGEITFGPNDIKYQLVKIDIEPNYKKAEDIMFAIGFSVLYLLKRNVRAHNQKFPYIYFPKWSEIKE